MIMEGMEKLVGVLTEMAGQIEDLAASIGPSDAELAEINAGKSQEEIDLEDKMAAQIAAPLVNALDSITDIVNGATEKIMGMAAEQTNETEESEEPEMKAAQDASWRNTELSLPPPVATEGSKNTGSTYTINEKLQAYSSFFVGSTAGFTEIDKVFERLTSRATQLLEKYGTLDDDDEAGEAENAQLSQLRILERDLSGFLKNYRISIEALRDELNKKIEFGEALIQAMEEGQ